MRSSHGRKREESGGIKADKIKLLIVACIPMKSSHVARGGVDIILL